MSNRVVVVYCCPVSTFGSEHHEYAKRFVNSWMLNPPLFDHSLVVVSNGGEPSIETKELFQSIPTISRIHIHDGTAKDIGSYQSAAPTIESEVVVFFGGHSYFTKPKWLERMMRVYDEFGPNLYGAFASMVYNPHIRTTGFWMPLELFNRYPNRITNDEERYRFEHRPGNYCLTDWVLDQGRNCFMVTWNDVFARNSWPDVLDGGEILNKDRGDYLLRDRVTDVLAVQYSTL